MFCILVQSYMSMQHCCRKAYNSKETCKVIQHNTVRCMEHIGIKYNTTTAEHADQGNSTIEHTTACRHADTTHSHA